MRLIDRPSLEFRSGGTLGAPIRASIAVFPSETGPREYRESVTCLINSSHLAAFYVYVRTGPCPPPPWVLREQFRIQSELLGDRRDYLFRDLALLLRRVADPLVALQKDCQPKT